MSGMDEVQVALTRAQEQYGQRLRDARMIATGYFEASGDSEAALEMWDRAVAAADVALTAVVEMAEALAQMEQSTPEELGEAACED